MFGGALSSQRERRDSQNAKGFDKSSCVTNHEDLGKLQVRKNCESRNIYKKKEHACDPSTREAEAGGSR
jgi:hypothetical protein